MTTSAAELEVSAKIPPDWKDWINEFPTIKSIAVFCLLAWVGTYTSMWLVGALGYFGYAPADKGELILKLLDRGLDALNWLTAAAVFGVVGKFATTKPEVIRAEGEVKAKVVAAQAVAAATAEYPVPTALRPPDPAGMPPVATAASAIDIGNQLAREAQDKAARQAGTAFEGD